ncbi:hypothetical protein [Streptomyces sp. 1222.5]|uniref:hypothetical protein n=1 Tax=Streptomyces sp. 1222.5 TaxID=1881026 RepID=UPI003EBB5324
MSNRFQTPLDPPPPIGRLHVRSGRRELITDGQTLSIDNQIFQLSTIDRIAFRAASRINEASYMIGVSQGKVKRRFTFNAYRRGTEMESRLQEWTQLASILDFTAGPHITHNILEKILDGQDVTFGSPPATRIDADAEGLRLRRPFMKKVPWDQIVDADMHRGAVRVHISRGNSQREIKPVMSIDMHGWNAVTLPRVVALLHGRSYSPFKFDSSPMI